MSRVLDEVITKYNKLIDTVKELRKENQYLTKEIYRLQALNKAYIGAIAKMEEELDYLQFLISDKGENKMNKMKEIAGMLGLEWIDKEGRSEIFSVLDDENKLMGDDFYISIVGLNRVREFQIYAHTFSRLLAGDNNMRKHLRKGDAYYIIDSFEEKGYAKLKWINDPYDKRWLRKGMIYRTEKEAQEAVQKLGWDIDTETP